MKKIASVEGLRLKHRMGKDTNSRSVGASDARLRPPNVVLGLAAAAALIAVTSGLACKQGESATERKAIQIHQTESIPSPASVAASTLPKDIRAQPLAKVQLDGPQHLRDGAKCVDVCRITLPLHCKNAGECIQRCESMASLPVCTAEMGRLFDCLLRQRAANWECDEDGIGAIRDPFCDKEQELLAGCMHANLAH